MPTYLGKSCSSTVHVFRDRLSIFCEFLSLLVLRMGLLSISDRSKAVLLLCFLSITCSICMYMMFSKMVS